MLCVLYDPDSGPESPPPPPPGLGLLGVVEDRSLLIDAPPGDEVESPMRLDKSSAKSRDMVVRAEDGGGGGNEEGGVGDPSGWNPSWRIGEEKYEVIFGSGGSEQGRSLLLVEWRAGRCCSGAQSVGSLTPTVAATSGNPGVC
jgi:hypothetical protein